MKRVEAKGRGVMSKREKFRDAIEDINLKIEQLGFKKDALLRKAGWDHSSNNVGCVWLWSKKIGGRVYRVNKETAIHMEMNSDIGGRR